jgi:PGAP1-like protein
MAVIVGVHGIAQQFRGGYQLGTVWYDALRDGLVAADHRQVADALPPTSLRVAFFGDLFRPAGAMAAQDPPYSAADVRPGPERDLLTEFYNAAVEQDPSLGAPQGAMGPGKVAVQIMLDRLLRSPTFANVAQRAFIGNLKQVNAFLSDESLKERVLARVHEIVDGSTRVVIGHSLGSVVAYEYLCRYRPAAVELLVTLGSPLGIPHLVFDRLTPAPVGGAGTWPGDLASWANVADSNDIVALRKQLAGLFSAGDGLTAVDDRLVDNGSQAHAVDRYLSARETGEMVGHVLG